MNEMSELLTKAELEKLFSDEVEKAGGAKKWLKKHGLEYYRHSLHMIANGSGATLSGIPDALGYRAVTRYERIPRPRGEKEE